MYAGQAVSDCNRDYVKVLVCETRATRASFPAQMKPQAETTGLLYDIQMYAYPPDPRYSLQHKHTAITATNNPIS